MLEKQSLTNQRIIDCLKINYGINATTLTLLALGADMDASVYKVYADNSTSFFVKLKRGHDLDISATIQTLLYDAGIKQIISAVKTIHGQLIQHIDEFTLIVYPFIQGQDGFSKNLTNEQWITFGKALRQIHDFQLSPLIKGKIKKEAYSSKWQEAVRKIYTQIEAEQIVHEKTALKLLTFMKKHTEIIQRLVNRAEQLGQEIQKWSSEFVLCHSDIHAGNVFIGDNGAIFIIDWDHPILAPKERDLMFIGGGVANVWNNRLEQEFFYKGYGKTEINMTILAYYRYERIVEDIAIYAQALFLTTDGGQDRPKMYKHFMDMFEPFGVVDIAFETEKSLIIT